MEFQPRSFKKQCDSVLGMPHALSCARLPCIHHTHCSVKHGRRFAASVSVTVLQHGSLFTVSICLLICDCVSHAKWGCALLRCRTFILPYFVSDHCYLCTSTHAAQYLHHIPAVLKRNAAPSSMGVSQKNPCSKPSTTKKGPNNFTNTKHVTYHSVFEPFKGFRPVGDTCMGNAGKTRPLGIDEHLLLGKKPPGIPGAELPQSMKVSYGNTSKTQHVQVSYIGTRSLWT